MAPTAATMNPTLRMNVEGAAGARATGPEAVKRSKTGNTPGNYKVSNNLLRRYPSRDATVAPGIAESTGATSPSLVPSEEEDITDDEETKPAAKGVCKSTDEDDEDNKPAAKVTRTSAVDDREETGRASDKTEPGLDVTTLPYGMQPLEDNTDVPGTVAAHFLAMAGKLYGTNDEASVKKFGEIADAL